MFVKKTVTNSVSVLRYLIYEYKTILVIGVHNMSIVGLSLKIIYLVRSQVVEIQDYL